jgi:transmembrane sensor
MIEDQPTTRRTEREAADWFSRMNQTRVENEDLAAFAEWRRDPDNLAAYNRMEDISRAVRAMKDDPDMQAAAREAATRPLGWRDWLAGFLARPGGRWGTGLALAGAVAASTIAWLALTAPTYSTAVGEQFSARLEDGSRVQLNTDTRLRVRFSGGERRVELQRGEAFFEVAHDGDRPFIVAAGSAQVRAIGTRFDVRRDDGEVRVTLAEGRVAVRDDKAATTGWTLSPGQSLALGPRATGATPTTIDVPAATAWTTGRLSFRDVTLADAVSEINRYSRSKIVLGPGAPADRKINGVFATGDTDEFVAAVTALYALKSVRRLDGRLELRSADAAPA